MKKPKNTLILNATTLQELTPGETMYFHDCEDLHLPQSSNYREISEAHVITLMESIQETGIQAEVALLVSYQEDGGFAVTIEDGHHRLEAVKRLREEADRSGRHWLYRALPCRVRVAPLDQAKGSFAISSVLRNQLRKEENLWDKLAAFERLKEAGETTTGIAKLVGMDERSVRRILSLRRLPLPVRHFAKENETSIKAATLYKLAAILEKRPLDGEEEGDSLFSTTLKDTPERVALARDIARSYMSEKCDLTSSSHPDSTAIPNSSAMEFMLTFLALDKTPKPKGSLWTRASAASSGSEAEQDLIPECDDPSQRPVGLRIGATNAQRSRIPQGWVALDPVRLETLMCDAGIPEEWRTIVSNLIVSQNN